MAAVAKWGANLVILALSIMAISHELPRIINDEGLWDFGSFVASGRAAAEGLSPYGIYPLTLHVELPGFEAWNPNLNPPISALLFQLFEGPDPRALLEAWQWISLVFYAAAVLLLVGRFWSLEAPVIAIWAFALAGFWDTLFLGQIYLPLVFTAVLAWLLLERRRLVAAGILIGLVVCMKPNFLVWPALLMLAGYWRPALVSIGTAAVISAIPLIVYGPEVYGQWFGLIESDKARAFFLTNASLSGLAARMGMPLLGAMGSLALLAVLALWALLRRPEIMVASAFALIASLVASPLGWIHYTLFLLPVLVSRWHKPAIRIVAVILLVPVPYVIDQFAKEAWIQVTVGSIYGWALLLCLASLAVEQFRGPGAMLRRRSLMPKFSNA